ncbi:MAG: hypothetical protein HPY51_04400 [Candidatus Omnitrophica bacterium]|nr:hypothetical protein [Candidatus Omnitrophota bacterium]HXK92083.1 hypothetical protein [bacterium]
MAHRDDLNTSLITLIGFLSAILLFALIVGLQIGYYAFKEREFARKVVNERPAELTQTIAKQQEQLHAYRWVNEASREVAIPIGRAMELVVKEHQ